MMIALLFGLDGTPLLLPHKQFVSPLPLFGHVLKKQKRCGGVRFGGPDDTLF